MAGRGKGYKRKILRLKHMARFVVLSIMFARDFHRGNMDQLRN